MGDLQSSQEHMKGRACYYVHLKTWRYWTADDLAVIFERPLAWAEYAMSTEFPDGDELVALAEGS